MPCVRCAGDDRLHQRKHSERCRRLRPGKVQALRDAVQAAQDVVNDPTATADELKAANKAMTKAAQELWEIVSKAELNALIQAANGYLDGDYTTESLEALKAAITLRRQWQKTMMLRLLR